MGSVAVTRAACAALDAEDPLRGFRDEFAVPDGLVYLNGNSLGVLPRAAVQRAREVVTGEWGDGLVRSWNTAGWFDPPRRLGEQVGRLLDAGEGTTVVTDSTSVNLFKALAAAVRIQEEDRPGRRVIVSERDNFPTDLYVAQGLADLLDRGWTLRLVDDAARDLAGALDDTVAVVTLSHVSYRSGRLLDLESVTRAVHAAGALMVWDLSHSAGAVPLSLSRSGADMAVGCTYKYLNAGPGAPAFIWVAHRHQDRFTQPLSGWWGHARPFAMEPAYEPAGGIGRFLCGTQPIASLSLVETGLDAHLRADPGHVRAKSLALGDLFISLVEQRCGRHPLTLVTPRDHRRRGSHVSFRHPHAYAVVRALAARGVVGDYREPELMRFGLTPLYLRHVDVWDAVDALAEVLDSGSWEAAGSALGGLREREAVT
ncbi:kynureninase [Phycicoccus sp. M110.8]|uniref:kynureninase n=1 Tax=Phycicoccus sp. M110.8 TaxID=3075433 RepID=UPI0028FD2985|nr:kynureninase [Phycicoccus sp. M110.8]MDU0313063.1 kynureninase [Phycicoccus sp. M110.8]